MKRICAWCGKSLDTGGEDQPNGAPITHGICPTCARKVLGHSHHEFDVFLDTLPEPVLAVDKEGIVLHANSRARLLLQKDLQALRNKLGGEVIECEYSKSPGGCGSTEYCQTGCVIRRSVTYTFSTGRGVDRRLALQSILTPSGFRETRFLISTEKAGDLVMLRIDEIDGTDSSA